MIPVLQPYGIPAGVDARTSRQAIETRLNDLLDQSMALITALDLMEVACDLKDSADDESSLGAGPIAAPAAMASSAITGRPTTATTRTAMTRSLQKMAKRSCGPTTWNRGRCW